VSSRSARNILLAVASAVGVVAAVLQVVASSLSLADFLRFPEPTAFKVAVAFGVVGWVCVLAAFAVALAGFLLRSRRGRTTVLAVSAGLFVGFGLSILVAALINLIKSGGLEPWAYKVSQSAEITAGAFLAVAAVLVLIGVLSARPDGILGWGSVGLAGYFAMLAVAYSFELAGILSFVSPPAEISGALGTHAFGHLVTAAAAVVAAPPSSARAVAASAVSRGRHSGRARWESPPSSSRSASWS
jgi:hypothetical protein